MTNPLPPTPNPAPAWTRYVLIAAAFYNLAWGTWVILRPDDLFHWTGITPPRYPGIWQCVGMIVGVYGVGYYLASRDPIGHWPIVAVGMLGKIFGPIGFLQTWLTTAPDDRGYLPPAWGLTIITNDLIWWIPFVAILWAAFRHHTALPATTTGEPPLTLAEANRRYTTDTGETLDALSHRSELHIVFLRHSGCTFCREALADLHQQLPTFHEQNITPVVVHQGSAEGTRAMLDRYDLSDLSTVHDPGGHLYRAYALPRGTFGQLFGPTVWHRGFIAAILERHGVGKLDGDGFQMGGTFRLHRGRLTAAAPQTTAADTWHRPPACVVR